MNEAQSKFIEIHQLQMGMHIELDLGWMAHPFPKGSFKITTEKQISVIQGLGLKRVRFIPSKSDLNDAPEVVDQLADQPAQKAKSNTATLALEAEADADALRLVKQHRDLLESQQNELARCERRYVAAIREQKSVLSLANSKPQDAAAQCLALVNSFVGEMLAEGESAIRLLSDGIGDKASIHPVNVTIISLLLGKSLGLSQADMVDLGMAAFLHDMGKTELPERVRWVDDSFSSTEYKLYQDHVELSVGFGKRMGLSAGALQAIAQHHELVDGSGFPARLKGDSLSMTAKILALVDRYENLCNPLRPTAALTPHEALSLIFAQLKNRYDNVVLSAFIRMMGVYPPGSVVQLIDERLAIVVSVNSSRPLKPRVLVHDPRISRHEALILDIEKTPNISIRRSLKPSNVSQAALDYLVPRQRICYFYDVMIKSSANEMSV